MKDFDRFYEELLKYKEKNGNVRVPYKYEINGYKLGRKATEIRCGNCNFTEEQKERLISLGFSMEKLRKVNNYDFEDTSSTFGIYEEYIRSLLPDDYVTHNGVHIRKYPYDKKKG